MGTHTLMTENQRCFSSETEDLVQMFVSSMGHAETLLSHEEICPPTFGLEVAKIWFGKGYSIMIK